jgi:hypothetical protein
MVQLSAGPMGGEFVDATGWTIGDEQVFAGLIYRRIDETTAVYCGAA